MPNPERDRDKVGKAIDGSDLDKYPPGHVERKRREAQSALRMADSTAVGILGPLAKEALGEHSDRFTKLNADARAEAALLVEEFRGRTRQEQADLIARGRRAAARGDLQDALAHQRAAQVLSVPSGEFDHELAAIDPERKAAKSGMAVVQKLGDTWHGDEARRHVSAGMADKTEEIGLIGWSHQQGFAQKADARPYIEQLLGE